MEELLNKRIDEWWKPFRISKEDIRVCSYDKAKWKTSIWFMNWSSPSEYDYDWLFISDRELTSKESWLIEWLMNKEKINQDELENVAMGRFDDESPVYSIPLWTDRLIMILSAEDNPMEVLVSLLK